MPDSPRIGAGPALLVLDPETGVTVRVLALALVDVHADAGVRALAAAAIRRAQPGAQERAHSSGSTPGRHDRLMTYRETADQLHVSVPTLRRRVHAGAIPVVRDGRLVRFRPADVEAFVIERSI